MLSLFIFFAVTAISIKLLAGFFKRVVVITLVGLIVILYVAYSCWYSDNLEKIVNSGVVGKVISSEVESGPMIIHQWDIIFIYVYPGSAPPKEVKPIPKDKSI